MSKILKTSPSKKKKITFFVFGFALCLMVFGGAQLSVAKAQEGGSIEAPEDFVLRAVASYVIDHGDGILAGKLLDILLQRKEERLGIIHDPGSRSPVERTCYRDGDGLQCVAEGWEIIPISTTAATTTFAERHRMNDTIVYLDDAEIQGLGFVSSSFRVFMGTSTSQYVTSTGNASSTEIPRNLIQGTHFPTSSRRIEFDENYTNIVKSTSTARTVGVVNNGNGTKLTSSTFVVIFLQDFSSQNNNTGICANIAQCEPVTSTAHRGGEWQARYKYHYVVNL